MSTTFTRIYAQPCACLYTCAGGRASSRFFFNSIIKSGVYSLSFQTEILFCLPHLPHTRVRACACLFVRAYMNLRTCVGVRAYAILQVLIHNVVFTSCKNKIQTPVDLPFAERKRKTTNIKYLFKPACPVVVLGVITYCKIRGCTDILFDQMSRCCVAENV